MAGTSTDHDADPLIGQVLNDRYRILGVLGKGGFSVVYRAEHASLGRPLAIKVLPRGHELVAWLRPRFDREAKMLATLTHPNIVSVVDYGFEDVPYLVMELVEGQLLRGVIDQGALPLPRALHLAGQLLRGLDYAHARGVMHRDLKPSNVVIADLPDSPDHVKILDFGFGKWFGPGEKGGETPLTEQGKTFGTPGYIAPERLHGEPAEGRADLYAVGVILFEMLTGRRPFEGTPLEMMQAHMLAPVPALAEVRPDLSLPRGLEAVIHRAMSKRPGDRYGTAGEMLEGLQAVVAPPPTPPPPTPPPAVSRPPVPPLPAPSAALRALPLWVRRSPWRLAAAGAAVVVLIGVGLTLLALVPDRDEAPAERDAFRLTPDLEEGAVDLGKEIPVPDPWATGVPPELAPIRTRLERGERVGKAELAPVFAYVRRHADDPRPHLLFGAAYMRLGYREVAIQRYRRAHRQDPAARGDPRMLRDLLVAAAGGTTRLEAARAVREIYGREALPSLGRAIRALSAHPGAAANLVALESEIARTAPAAVGPGPGTPPP